MKTLYESILDDDVKIMDRADKKAEAYLERKKKIDLVLDAFEELALDYDFKWAHDLDFGPDPHINSRDAIARYFSKRNKNKAGKQELIKVYRFLKDKFTSIWDECMPEENLTLNNGPCAAFVFKNLGIRVWINLDNRSNTLSVYNDTYIMICFDKKDKYVEDAINKLVKKTS